jgi:hypothetical protein
MWNTATIWFDLAVVFAIFAFGNILFGHFEQHRSKSRRVLKVVVVATLTALLSMVGLRWVAYAALGLLVLFAAYVHLRWLPNHGINGWTGEPKAKYYDLLKVPQDRRPST